MQTASLSELKKELSGRTAKEVFELCLRLAKHKKENKELLTYLLFESDNESQFIANVKMMIEADFEAINKSHVYLAKKTLRKTLRNINKYIRFSASETIAVTLLLFFCQKLKSSGLPLETNTVLGNMYAQQIKNIQKAISKMHEDLQYDYGHLLHNLLNS